MRLASIIHAWLWRVALVAVGAAAVLFCVWQFATAQYGRGWHHAPESAPWVLGYRARALLEQSLQTDDGKVVVDGAVKLLSHGQLSGPTFVNASHTAPSGGTFNQPWAWWHYRVKADAAGATFGPDFDAEYISRVLRQIRAMPDDYRARILARAPPIGETASTTAAPVVTNRYVAWLASRAPDRLEPVVSIVPAHPDAAKRLKRWLEQGVEYVRWLPIRQQIELNSRPARAFYELLAKADIGLMLPVGALDDVDGNRRWISPAAIEAIVAAGVDVQITVAGTRGPDGQNLMPVLFQWLATTDHPGRITILLTAVLSGDRPRRVLAPLLAHPQYYDRLQYASGYPGSAVDGSIDVEALAAQGFIDRALVHSLRSIYDVNPLAFRLAVMRSVHLPYTRLGFPASVFAAATEKGSADDT